MKTTTTMKRGATNNNGTALGERLTNDAAEVIETTEPYGVSADIEGTCAIIMHRWSCEDVEAKGKAAKGSKSKKTDNVESYVYRNAEGEICIPGEYFRQSIIHAAKFKQDPRSPRKSAMDLFKAGVMVTDTLCSLNIKTWDYLDKRRVRVQQSAITRTRPALLEGWKTTVTLGVLTPEYIAPMFLLEVLSNAGRLVGIAEIRPTYGRFQVTRFDVKQFS